MTWIDSWTQWEWWRIQQSNLELCDWNSESCSILQFATTPNLTILSCSPLLHQRGSGRTTTCYRKSISSAVSSGFWRQNTVKIVSEFPWKSEKLADHRILRAWETSAQRNGLSLYSINASAKSHRLSSCSFIPSSRTTLDRARIAR